VQGILGTDRYAVYANWPSHKHQFCWAHLKRLFTKFSERPGTVGELGEELLAEQHRLFEWWHRVRDGTLKRTTFRTYVVAMKMRLDALLVRGVESGCDKTSATCANLLKSKHALWTFVSHEGVEPTNNVAEQALRHPVIMRKLCFGSQSEHGCRFIERVATVYATRKQQGRSTIDFVFDACSANLAGQAAPSLLPRAAPI
jgi:transposase